MVNGHRVFRFSEAVAAVDKEQMMREASQGQPTPTRKFVEFRVRANTVYEITEYTGEAAGGSVEQVASGLSARQAENVIGALARAFPHARITRLQVDERTFAEEILVSDPQGVEKSIYDRLSELPVGSKITFSRQTVMGTRGCAGLVKHWSVPVSTDPPGETDAALLKRLGDDAGAWAREFSKRFPAIDESDAIGWFANAIEHSGDVRRWRKESETQPWSINTMTYGEVEDAKTVLGRLPYDVAAAMRRNAQESGDAVMLLLLDEAKVAVDA